MVSSQGLGLTNRVNKYKQDKSLIMFAKLLL